MAVPKRKYPKARQGKRRSHDHLVLTGLVPCPQCHNMRRPHHVCPVCGTFRGRTVIEQKAPKKKEA